MSLIDILVILGCLAGGYWIVSSVMGPGVDITRRDQGESPAGANAARDPVASRAKTLPNPHRSDWNLLLDLPHSASRADIEAAYKRQLNKALASGDAGLQERLRLAREAALAQLARPDSLRE